MAQKDAKPPESKSRKRKEPPTSQKARFTNSKKQKVDHRARFRDARTLSTQTTSNAFRNGELDVERFVKAREFEIRALEEGMQQSRKLLNKRTFQQVPRELRRRTASHDAKRVPQRLRAMARKEMIQDQTPTVNSRTRKATGHQHLRKETAKKLRALGSRKKAAKEQQSGEKMEGIVEEAEHMPKPKPSTTTMIKTRAPRIKKAALAKPPIPKAKFRKRQLDKSWLPTHIFHAKRTHMTLPKSPLWRFAIPLTPTQKSYRTVHRAALERGAVTWDTSYMSTIGLTGERRSIEGMFKALGVSINSDSKDIRSWQNTTQILDTLIYEREAPHFLIAPATIIWCAESAQTSPSHGEAQNQKRKVFVRVHPSAFFQLWNEILRLAKVAKPGVSVEDLRYEIGSIEIIGPGSTEALLGSIWPYEHVIPGKQNPGKEDRSKNEVGEIWKSLAGVSNPSILSTNALLAFDAQDPRLRHPPRTISLPGTEHEQHKLLESIAALPFYSNQTRSPLFDRSSRLKASRLPSQKSINRRKSLALPGEYPIVKSLDPPIPVMLYVSTNRDRKLQSSWTLLLPWKCVQPFWYSIVYYPLSTGQQPRYAGLREKRQLAFENGQAWFPADFPGSQAGWEWEVHERQQRWDEWARRPRAKRTSWEKVDLGGGRKGEIGQGWSCHWELFLESDDDHPRNTEVDISTNATGDISTAREKGAKDEAVGQGATEDLAERRKLTFSSSESQDQKANAAKAPPTPLTKPKALTQLSAAQAHRHLQTALASIPPGGLASICVTCVTRGTPQACARIYRLPSEGGLRQRWLDLLPLKRSESAKRQEYALPSVAKNLPAHVVRQRLAHSLLEPPSPGDEGSYPPCPGIEDLVGFVTSGNFNLAEGKGVGIGCIVLSKVVESVRESAREGRLCIVRNAGESVARLARWEIV